jgi:hypothetical protein
MNTIVHIFAFILIIINLYLYAKLLNEKKLLLLLLLAKKKYILANPATLFCRLAKIHQIPFYTNNSFINYQNNLLNIKVSALNLLFSQINIEKIIVMQKKSAQLQIKVFVNKEYNKEHMDKINKEFPPKLTISIILTK